MYLLLGPEHDDCLVVLLAALRDRGDEAEIMSAPFGRSVQHTWEFNSESCRSRWKLRSGEWLSDDDISGVILRTGGGIDRSGWDDKDFSFMQAEHQAAVIGWIWSLRCPVINRLPAALWFHRHLPSTFWEPVLSQSGLQSVEVMLSNDPRKLDSFRLQHSGAEFSPLTGDAHYRPDKEMDWEGLADVLEGCPLWVTAPRMGLHRACVIGDKVIWARERPASLPELESALTRFASRAGLGFVEIGIFHDTKGVRIANVDVEPSLSNYPVPARRGIVASLLDGLSDLRYSRSENTLVDAEISLKRAGHT